MSNGNNPTAPDALACTLTVVGFNADGTPATSARLADLILCHWSISNLTSTARTLTFAGGQRFKLRLLDDQKNVIWEMPAPAPGEDLVVQVASNDTYSVPIDTAQINDADVPRIDLKSVVASAQVDPKTELTVEFRPLAAELGQVTSLQLWR